jgi:hypothetical protein
VRGESIGERKEEEREAKEKTIGESRKTTPSGKARVKKRKTRD